MCTIRAGNEKTMELECTKFNERMKAEGAFCRHPDDYCKYRTSCIIYFIEKENNKSGKSSTVDEAIEKKNNSRVPNG